MILAAIAVVMNVVGVLAMSGTAGVHLGRPVRISLACGSLVLIMIAGALRFGADVWDPRLFSWGTKRRR